MDLSSLVKTERTTPSAEWRLKDSSYPWSTLTSKDEGRFSRGSTEWYDPQYLESRAPTFVGTTPLRPCESSYMDTLSGASLVVGYITWDGVKWAEWHVPPSLPTGH